MGDFAEPSPRLGDDTLLNDVREQVRASDDPAPLGSHSLSLRDADDAVYSEGRALEHCRYHAAKKRLFFFDYDGTLAPIAPTPSMAVPAPATLEALEKLSADPQNVVYVTSGRDAAFLEQHLGHLARVGFSAEHGAFMRAPGARGSISRSGWTWAGWTRWRRCSGIMLRFVPVRLRAGEDADRAKQRPTGSIVEVKKTSIPWHYRASDPEWGLLQCKRCQDQLETSLAHKRPIVVSPGKKNLEVTPIAVNKGEIVMRLLYKNPDAEFIFCAGDDKRLEDTFRALLLFPLGSASTTATATMETPLSGVFTTAVGPSSKPTLARWHVRTPEEVVEHMLGLVSVKGGDGGGGTGVVDIKSPLSVQILLSLRFKGTENNVPGTQALGSFLCVLPADEQHTRTVYDHQQL
ncbi:trehalose-phosphatase-domain-containing protein [Mycena sp. CBHHK59/15]|nr:trehalose-phosphatase-domain-containing protein [Mycena sp. CBHHK59/15]